MTDIDAQRRLLAELPGRLATELSADPRVAAVWLGGSLGRGEGDALSDIDLVVVCAPGAAQDVSSSLDDRLDIAGPIALIHEAPQNAPAEGRQLNVLYDVDPIPLYIDWNIWPNVPRTPADVSTLYERDPIEVDGQTTFDAMLDRMTLGTAPERTADVLDHFRVFMTPILAKHGARGWSESVERILDYMKIPTEPITSMNDVLAIAERVLAEHGSGEPPQTVACIRRYLSAVTAYR